MCSPIMKVWHQGLGDTQTENNDERGDQLHREILLIVGMEYLKVLTLLQVLKAKR